MGEEKQFPLGNELDKSIADFKIWLRTVLRYWYWVVCSIGVCLALGYVTIKKVTPAYVVSLKVFKKDSNTIKENRMIEACFFK